MYADLLQGDDSATEWGYSSTQIGSKFLHNPKFLVKKFLQHLSNSLGII